MTAALPILYSFRRCPYAMRARLAIDASGQVCELREVVLRDKPEEMLRASPKGTVPVLVDVTGAVIDQSLDIMMWALRRADPEGWLTGPLQEMLDLIERFDSHFKQHLDRYKYPNRFAGADAHASRTAALEELQTLQIRLMSNGYLCGDRLSLLDVALAPFVRQFAHVDATWFAVQPLPQVQAWLQRIVESERFVRIMQPIAPWVPGTRGIEFPFAA